MRRIWLLLILLLSLIGCSGNEGPIMFQDDTKVTSWLDDLTLRLHIENHTDQTVMAKFDIDIHHKWLLSQIDGESTIYEGYPGSEAVTEEFVKLNHQKENFFSISYPLKNRVNKQQFIKAIDQGAVEVTVVSKNGEKLANLTIDRLFIYDLDRMRNGSARLFLLFIVSLIGVVLVDKFVRYWTGIPKMEREEYPKSYKIITFLLNIGVTAFTTFFMQSIALGDFWKVLSAFVLLYFLVHIILQIIYFRNTKEYRISIINLMILLLFIAVLSRLFPYPLY